MPVLSKSPHRSVLDFKDEQALLNALKGLNVSKTSPVGDSTASTSDWQIAGYDKESSQPLSVEEEASRLSNLRDYDILETEAEPVFDRLTSKARKQYKAPWVCVSMVDLGRQWFKSLSYEPGHPNEMTDKETSRQVAFCAHTIIRSPQTDPILEVKDTHQDERFRNNPLVQKGPKLRYYAAAPLVSPEGHKLGALCILDRKPRPEGLSEEEHDQLLDLAQETVQHLVNRRRRRKELKQKQQGEQPVFGMTRKRSAEDLRSVKTVSGVPGLSRNVSSSSSEPNGGAPKRSRSPVPQVIAKQNMPLPDPKDSVHPDKFLLQLVEAMHGVKLQVTPATQLKDYFIDIQESQMAAYTVEVVSVARANDVEKMKAVFAEKGRSALDCYNRFGEGMLNLACRRGFKDMTRFLLEEVQLDIHVSDDYGRTPMHDTCWNPEPQLEICLWLLQRDPSLFLISDKRGFTPFQYARDSDHATWRNFLFQNRHCLDALVQPRILEQFSS